MRIFIVMMTLLLSTGVRAQTQIVTDLQGRSVAVNTPVKRLFLADARDILAVDIAAGKTHFPLSADGVIPWRIMRRIWKQHIWRPRRNWRGYRFCRKAKTVLLQRKTCWHCRRMRY